MTADSSWRWAATFPPEAAAVGRARLAVKEALTLAGLGSALTAQALLVLSEMASNSVRHARTEFTLTMTRDTGTLRLEVFDRDTRPPALLGLDAESTSGRGLQVIAGIASDWGWQTAESAEGVSGKAVWAELAIGDGE